jgi:hypothetical protein
MTTTPRTRGPQKRKSDKKKEKHKKLMAESVVTNEQQCVDFKLNPGKKWEQFAGKRLDQQANLNSTVMCAHWHMRGNCFNSLSAKSVLAGEKLVAMYSISMLE